MKQLYAMQEATDTGSLQVNVTSRLQNTPIKGATITLSYSGDPDVTLESVQTDESGQTQTLTLDAPPVEYSFDSAQENQPFSLYTIQIRAEGYQPPDEQAGDPSGCRYAHVYSITYICTNTIQIHRIRICPFLHSPLSR